jgi:hypothetical protein
MTGREWILALAEELGVEAPGDADVARLLELAGVAADGSERLPPRGDPRGPRPP